MFKWAIYLLLMGLLGRKGKIVCKGTVDIHCENVLFKQSHYSFTWEMARESYEKSFQYEN